MMPVVSDSWPFPAPVDNGGADHLQAGLAIPDIALRASNGEMVSPCALKGLCVLFLYPYTGRAGLVDPPGWDDIPGAHGSTPELETIGRLYENFRALGVDVFGVSTQGRGHHQELIDRLELPFLLLSDCGFSFQAALDLPMFCAGKVPYLKRLTLVLDGGKIVTSFYPVHPPDEHPQRVLEWLEGRA